ncbi:MAG: trigger factor [Chloroflexia bacterium]|nr:trigger factor [Chloroflexia bacterium]
MKLSVERQPASLVMLDITADEDEFSQAMDRAFRKTAREIQIPGFRKGKAPRGLIERTYGREVFLRDAADDVMDRLYREALEQEKLVPVGEPDVEIVELEPVSFKVTFPVFPTIEPGDYTSVRVESEDATVTDDDVNEVLEQLRRTQAPWVDPSQPRKAREGDQVNIDYDVKQGDDNFQEPVKDAQFILGETNLLVQLRERIEEMEIGQTETFELAFDEEDTAADPSIRGKALTYTVTLNSVQERQLPELDDEFAKAAGDAASLDDLRQQVRDDVHQGKTSELRTTVVNKIISAMGEGAELDPPSVMVDEEVEHQINHLKQNLAQSGTPYEAYLRAQDKTEDDLRDDLRPNAERRLRNSLLMQEIAKRDKVEVTDEDIDAEIDRMLGPAPDAESDDEGDEQQNRMREIYRSAYFRNMMKTDLLDRKLTDHLIEIATEGRGAVLNGWEPKEAPEETVAEDSAAIAAAAHADEDAPSDEASTSTTDVGNDASAGNAGSDESTSSVVTAETADQDSSEDTMGGVVTIDTGSVDDAAAEFPTLEGERGDGWVKGDGENKVPDGYPIKGNANSMIYHPQESRFYDNTVAEYYFATPEVAETFGFRAPKGVKKADSGA